jgi:hypothetical protein
MNSELERLIELTLVNGSISQKERDVLSAKAQSLGVSSDELDVIIQAKIDSLVDAQVDQTPRKHGVVKVCPACGASVQPYAQKCICRHVFRFDTLKEMIDDVSNHPDNEVTIIRRTHVPIAQEPVREFLSYCLGQLVDPGRPQNVRDAWTAKLEEVISIAEGNSQLEIEQEYLVTVKRRLSESKWDDSVKSASSASDASIRDLQAKIDVMKREHLAFKQKRGNQADSSSDDAHSEKVALLIETFPVPTGKVELVDFLSACIVNGTAADPFGVLSNENQAWNNKAKSVIAKARLMFRNDEPFMKQLDQHEAQLTKTAKKSSATTLVVGALAIAGIVLWIKSC